MNWISRMMREATKSVYGTLRAETFWVLCMLSMLWEPVFLYIPVINDERKCFQFDQAVMSVIIAGRSVFDILYLINRTLEIRENYSKSLLLVSLVDLFIILPLPQVVVILAYSQVMNGQDFFFVMNYMFLAQYGLKVIRLYVLITKKKRSYNLTKWAKLTFNLFWLHAAILSLHAAIVIGSLWYFFSVQKKTACWRKACTDSIRCDHLTLHCDDSLTNYTFSNEFCSAKTQDATIYDFGMFHDAIQSGVVEQNNFFQRFLPGIQWSLQTLCSFGQGLPLSTNVKENIFVISITITGVVVFSILIDRAVSKLSIEDERSQKLGKIYRWLPFRKLPKRLQRKIKKHLLPTLEETTVVDVEYVMENLPDDIGKKLKRKLGLDLLKKVEEFGKESDSSLKKLCDVMKPVVFIEDSPILKEGSSINQMVFVLQGTSQISSNSGNNHLADGDFSGEEQCFSRLIEWANADRPFSRLPDSTKTIHALTKVEALVIKVGDLKQLYIEGILTN